jgi:heat-inducible transcriptional repressor
MRNSNSAVGKLDERGQMVLSAIINEHLVTGEPVGSRVVAETAGWSSATVRNVMAELEDADLVEQPHTSAGRVPTDKGYRYYLDHSFGTGATGLLSYADQMRINRELAHALLESGDMSLRLMEQVSHLLSQLSENVGIVVSPRPSGNNRLQHIEFVQLSDGRILVVLVYSPNIVQNRLVRFEEEITQDELERAARYLNAEFSGKALTQIRAEILALMREEKTLYDKLLRNAALLCERSLANTDANETGDVFIDGASNILIKPDFADRVRLSELLRTLEEKSRVVKILDECINRESLFGDVHVTVGRENLAPSMQNCALITASYKMGDGDARGTLGVVGPMRIEYARMMAVVNYVSQHVERMLRDEQS